MVGRYLWYCCLGRWMVSWSFSSNQLGERELNSFTLTGEKRADFHQVILGVAWCATTIGYKVSSVESIKRISSGARWFHFGDITVMLQSDCIRVWIWAKSKYRLLVFSNMLINLSTLVSFRLCFLCRPFFIQAMWWNLNKSNTKYVSYKLISTVICFPKKTFSIHTIIYLCQPSQIMTILMALTYSVFSPRTIIIFDIVHI